MWHIKAEHRCYEALFLPSFDLHSEKGHNVDCGFLPSTAELAWVEDAMHVAVILESVVGDFLQPFGGAVEEDDQSEGLQFGIIRFVGFRNDNSESSVEFLQPDSMVNKAVEEGFEALQYSVCSLGVLLWVNKVFEMVPMDVIPSWG